MFVAYTEISMESFQLSLQDKANTIIADLTASKSYVKLSLNEKNHTVAIRNSEFQSSKFSISDSLKDQTSLGTSDTTINALSLKNCSMNNSLLTVKLQTALVYELSLLGSSITNQDVRDSQTGVVVEIQNTVTLHMLVDKCSIVGNYYGIRVTAGGDSTVGLDVDQCFIAENGETSVNEDQVTGGVVVHSVVGSNTKITTNISSTILSRNTYTQIGFNSWGTTAVKIFNSTLRNSRGLPSLHILGIGALFQLGADGPNSNLMNVHLTQTHIEGNDIGINIQGEHSSYEATVTETTIKQNRHGILIGSFSYRQT